MERDATRGGVFFFLLFSFGLGQGTAALLNSAHRFSLCGWVSASAIRADHCAFLRTIATRMAGASRLYMYILYCMTADEG